MDFASVFEGMARNRPVFHSEADLQHEYAMGLRSHYPDAQLRLEVPFSFEKRGATDIVVRNSQTTHGIELKYLTRKAKHCIGEETFELKA